MVRRIILLLAAVALSSRGDSHLATEEVCISCVSFVIAMQYHRRRVIVVSYPHCNNLVASYPIYT